MTEKMAQTTKYPFCALVGQEMMKEAIVLNMIDPGLGGVLIRGQKGTAKTTAVLRLDRYFCIRLFEFFDKPSFLHSLYTEGSVYKQV